MNKTGKQRKMTTKKEQEQALQALQFLNRKKLQKKSKQRKQRIKPAPPRYDEVFFRGVDWLNKNG